MSTLFCPLVSDIYYYVTMRRIWTAKLFSLTLSGALTIQPDRTLILNTANIKSFRHVCFCAAMGFDEYRQMHNLSYLYIHYTFTYKQLRHHDFMEVF